MVHTKMNQIVIFYWRSHYF